MCVWLIAVQVVLVTDLLILLTERDQKFHLASLQDLKVRCTDSCYRKCSSACRVAIVVADNDLVARDHFVPCFLMCIIGP